MRRSDRLQPIRVLIEATPLLWRSRRDPALRRVMRMRVRWMPLCLFSEPLLWLRTVARGRRYLRPDQRPAALYVPHLPVRPFGGPDATSRRLEAHLEAIRREFALITGADTTTPSEHLVGSGSWTTFDLLRVGEEHPANVARCPATWAAVQECPLYRGPWGCAYFSVLHPGSRIAPHCGPINIRHRYHLAIVPAEGARIRCGDGWSTWEEGACLILDDSVEHEVVHDGAEPRVVLVVDCWHSDLTEPERAFLDELGRLPAVQTL